MPSQAGHHHGYLWLGSGLALLKDGPRRPEHPEFATSKVVPLELAHWLLKPPAFIRGTWNDPQEAAAWLGAQAQEHAEAFSSEHERDVEVIASKAGRAAEAAARGEDVVGGWYLTGRRFLSVCLIACSPHRFRPEYGCPQR
jgi:hypothetical protein